MKHKSTKERRLERETFVKNNRALISDLIAVGEPKLIQAFVQVARKEIGYSDKTNNCDIWRFIKRTFVTLPIK